MKNNSVNLDITPNTDGYTIGGGTTQRFLTVSGSNLTMYGSGSVTLTFPSVSTTIPGCNITNQFTQGQQFQAGMQVTGSVILANTITIKGGNPNNNYLLKCDATGAASWTTGSVVRVQVFTTPGAGTYTPWSGMTYCTVYVTGGGGASADATNTDSCTGGGGGGGTAIKTYSAAEIGASKPLIVGAAGVRATPGGAGGASTFGTGTTMTGSGGGGSTEPAGATTNIGFGGVGGNASGGDLNLSGSSGQPGIILTTTIGVGGNGGASIWGGGPTSNAINTAGTDGVAWGSGGSGGHASAVGNINGANGAVGVVYIEEYGT